MAERIEQVPPLIPIARGLRTRASAVLHPTAQQWAMHGVLFLLTVASTTFAGIFTAAPDIEVSEPPISNPLDYLLYLPSYYFRLVTALIQFSILHPVVIKEGLIFSVALLAILTAHEMGHYLACRRHGVNATLPFFLPAPPLFLAGTFGAFIKIKSPIPSRRSLLDIGLAGPLAGFIVTVPIAIVGILMIQPGTTIPQNALILNDPLLFRLIARLGGVELTTSAVPNPYYMAAWIGLLVTSLNLMPVGQLDGGHGTFAVFGAKLHQLIGRIAFVSAAVIAILGYVLHGSPSGFLFTILLGVMLRVRHPQPENVEALGTARIVIAVITSIVFLLSFWPFPITLT